MSEKLLPMTKLYLVRHGETDDNANQIMQGQTQGRLNPNGIRQAEELRDRMLHEPIDAFIASDLRRSVETCEIIAAPHHKEVVQTPLLRERDWGDFTGRYIPDLQGEEWPDNIESLERMGARARNFLTWLKVAYPGQTVLAVGHGIINKAVQSVYFNLPMSKVQKMMNAEVRVLIL